MPHAELLALAFVAKHAPTTGHLIVYSDCQYVVQTYNAIAAKRTNARGQGSHADVWRELFRTPAATEQRLQVIKIKSTRNAEGH